MGHFPSRAALLCLAAPAACQAAGVAGEAPTREDGAVPFYLWVPEETKRRFVEMCKQENVSIDEMLSRLARGRQPLILTWTTGSQKYVDLAMNLALSVRNNAPDVEGQFVCVALDRSAYRMMQRRKFHAVLHAVPEEGPELKDAIWKMRWLILHSLVHLGIDCLVMDSDIVVLRNPFKALHGDGDLEVMTDHFFPDRHLWQYWVRPEENINTGFLFARASPQLERLLADFLEEHWEPSVGGIPRYWMDQQVFNKFIERRMYHSDTDEVHGLYEQMVFRDVRARAKAERPIRLRVLDPVEVAHGMNYFWLRAHEGRGAAEVPVVAHANGVDSKEYFLRDRGLWQTDDFDRRFGGDYFLTYQHPHGLSLRRDFEHLTAAMVVAAALGRRLVLPNTMNCDNCPALEPYGATDSWMAEGCTFDYFAWSQSLMGHHGDLVVESSLVRSARFRRLSGKSLPGGASSASTLQRAAKELMSGPSSSTRGKTLSSRRLHIEDIEEAYEAVVEAGFSPSKVFECKFHDWPVGWMACRDQRFVAFHGEFSKCEPSPGQRGCGYRGIACCEAFWGWGEKLEYFTGRRWDLPCNCGLDAACEQRGSEQGEREVCCSHAENATAQRCDRPIDMDSVPSINAPEDTHTYTSSALAELHVGRHEPAGFLRTCRADRRLRGGVASEEALLLQCHRLASTYLLMKQNLQVLGEWCRFVHGLRRAPEVAGERDANAVAAPDRKAVASDASRGLNVPRCPAVAEPLRPGALASLAGALAAGRPAVLDAALRPEVAREVAAWLAEAAVWHETLLSGRVLRASLSDGLHCETLLRLAQELVASAEIREAVGGRLALEDAWAWKFLDAVPGGRWRGDPVPSADIIACLWLTRGGTSGGLELSTAGHTDEVAFRPNRLVLWTAESGAEWKVGSAPEDLELLRADVVFAFGRSLGRRGFPGLTRRTAD